MKFGLTIGLILAAQISLADCQNFSGNYGEERNCFIIDQKDCNTLTFTLSVMNTVSTKTLITDGVYRRYFGEEDAIQAFRHQPNGTFWSSVVTDDGRKFLGKDELMENGDLKSSSSRDQGYTWQTKVFRRIPICILKVNE